MNEAKYILKMIEDVYLIADGQEREKRLDDVDALVSVYLNKIFNRKEQEYLKHHWKDTTQYTRSRDALKMIRPDGYTLSLNINVLIANWESSAMLTECGGGYQTKPEYLPTEELAELYAIIQAIEYERTHP